MHVWRRPGSYAWPRLRRECERRAADAWRRSRSDAGPAGAGPVDAHAGQEVVGRSWSGRQESIGSADTGSVARRFRFRLEPARWVRARREERAQIELAQAIAALAAQQERAEAAARAVDGELERLRALMVEGAALHELRGRHEALAIARGRAGHERATAAQLEGVADERREELVRASQDRQALDRLEERQRAAHLREEARLEMVELDELANVRAARRRAGLRVA